MNWCRLNAPSLPMVRFAGAFLGRTETGACQAERR
jgi:hypothetical protein